MIVSGSCLEPVFKDGDEVVFDQSAPVEGGCFACFYYRQALLKPGQPAIALKRLVLGIDPSVKFPWKDNPKSDVVPVIIVEQFNPRTQWSVRCSELLAVHRCIGAADDPAVQAILNAEGWRT
jgi:hypothetical protein